MRTIYKQIFATLTTALIVLSISPVSFVLAATTPLDEDAQVECSDPSCSIDENTATLDEEDVAPIVEESQPKDEPEPAPAPKPKPRPKPAPRPAPTPVVETSEEPEPEPLEPEITEATLEQESIPEEPEEVVVSTPPLSAAVAPDPLNTNLAQIEEESGLDLTPGKSNAEVEVIDNAIKNNAAQKVQELLTQGVDPEEARKTGRQIIRTERAVVRVAAIDDVAKKNGIDTSAKGTTSDERLYQIAVLNGLNPKASNKEVEAKIYGAASSSAMAKTTTVSIRNNDSLSSEGFTALAAVPTANASYTIYMVGKNNTETALGTVTSSEDKKAVFALENLQIPDGQYSIIVRKGAPAKTSWFWQNNTAYAAARGEESKPVRVNMLKDTEVPAPVVKSLGGLAFTDTQNIKITQSADGKVHITGTADVSTMVVGTFKSAIFTSAMLADVDNGSFDIVSSEALAPGEHEVVIYATRPEEAAQSTPVKVQFSIVNTAEAASAENPTPQRSSAPASPLSRIPVLPIAGVVGIALVLTIAGVLARKKKNT